MLVAAMNPCVCGFLTDPQKECTCTPLQIQRYRSKVSGPLLDRIDIQVKVPACVTTNSLAKMLVKAPRPFGGASTVHERFSCSASNELKFTPTHRWVPEKSNDTAR
jgi:predicted ATPase with chaperone activity